MTPCEKLPVAPLWGASASNRYPPTRGGDVRPTAGSGEAQASRGADGPRRDHPASAPVLADADGRGVVLHRGDEHWRVAGRDRDGRHLCRASDVNGRDIRGAPLVPVPAGIPAWERRLARRPAP